MKFYISGVTLQGLPWVGSSAWGGEKREPGLRQGRSGKAEVWQPGFSLCLRPGGRAACLAPLGKHTQHYCVCCSWRGGRWWWSVESSEQAGRKEEAWVFPRALGNSVCGGGWIFQPCKGFKRSAPLSEYDLKEIMPSWWYTYGIILKYFHRSKIVGLNKSSVLLLHFCPLP